MSIMSFLSRTFKRFVAARLTKEAERLFDVLTAAVKIPNYKRGFDFWSDGRPKTYCNYLALDVLDSRCTKKYTGTFIDVFDYDIRIALLNEDFAQYLMTPLQTSYTKIQQAVLQNRATDVSPQAAQELANFGIPVLVMSSLYDHMAIVCPNSEVYDRTRGPKIAQAGWYNGIFYMASSEAFGAKWSDSEIRYVVFQKWVGE